MFLTCSYLFPEALTPSVYHSLSLISAYTTFLDRIFRTFIISLLYLVLSTSYIAPFPRSFILHSCFSSVVTSFEPLIAIPSLSLVLIQHVLFVISYPFQTHQSASVMGDVWTCCWRTRGIVFGLGIGFGEGVGGRGTLTGLSKGVRGA